MMNPKLIYLYIDDERYCPTEIRDAYIVITARDYYGAIDVIKFCLSTGIDMCIDFDHDLGEGKTGYDVAKYIVENNIPLKRYVIHSRNPVGTWNIQQLLNHYGYIYSNALTIY